MKGFKLKVLRPIIIINYVGYSRFNKPIKYSVYSIPDTLVVTLVSSPTHLKVLGL